MDTKAGKTLFECTTKEVAILKELRKLEYGKLYVIVQANNPIRIGLIVKKNLDDSTIKRIVLGEKGEDKFINSNQDGKND